MSRFAKGLLVGALSIAAFVAISGSASAALTGVSTPGGNFTATTTALQTLTTTAGIFFRIALTCLQTLRITVNARLYPASSTLAAVGTVTGATFNCNNGDTVTATGLPWTIGGIVNTTNVILPGTVLLTALGVRVTAFSNSFGSSCDFTGTVGFSVISGRTIGNLLGARLAASGSSLCSTGNVSPATYTVTPAPTFVILLA